jgi:hypothetical protein
MRLWRTWVAVEMGQPPMVRKLERDGMMWKGGDVGCVANEGVGGVEDDERLRECIVLNHRLVQALNSVLSYCMARTRHEWK